MRNRLGVAVLALAIVSVGCGGGDNQQASSKAEELIARLPAEVGQSEVGDIIRKADPKERYELGVALPFLASPIWRVIANGVELFATDLGVDIRIVDAGGFEQVRTQVDQVESLVQSGVDGILLATVDSEALAPVVRDAAEKGVPVVTFIAGETSGRAVTMISNELKQIGTDECRAMVDAGLTDIEVVMISGPPGSESLALRADGFRECAIENGMKILGETRGEASPEQGLNDMENFIQAFGDRIKGVYTLGASVGFGASQAIERALEAGRLAERPFLVTAAPDQELVDRLKRGEIGAAVDQLLMIISGAAVAAMVVHLNGESLPKELKVPTVTVTPETANTYDWSFSLP